MLQQHLMVHMHLRRVSICDRVTLCADISRASSDSSTTSDCICRSKCFCCAVLIREGSASGSARFFARPRMYRYISTTAPSPAITHPVPESFTGAACARK